MCALDCIKQQLREDGVTVAYAFDKGSAKYHFGLLYAYKGASLQNRPSAVTAFLGFLYHTDNAF